MAHAVDSLNDKPLGYRINIFMARMCFRGIYFPADGTAGLDQSDLPESPNHFLSRPRRLFRLAQTFDRRSRPPSSHKLAINSKPIFFNRRIPGRRAVAIPFLPATFFFLVSSFSFLCVSVTLWWVFSYHF